MNKKLNLKTISQLALASMVLLTAQMNLPQAAYAFDQNVKISHTANNQRIEDFFDVFSTSYGVNVRLDESITQQGYKVNYNFNDSDALSILNFFERNFAINWHYDGNLLHVFDASVTDQHVTDLTPSLVDNAQQHMQKLSALQGNNKIVEVGSKIIIQGSSQFAQFLNMLATIPPKSVDYTQVHRSGLSNKSQSKSNSHVNVKPKAVTPIAMTFPLKHANVRASSFKFDGRTKTRVSVVDKLLAITQAQGIQSSQPQVYKDNNPTSNDRIIDADDFNAVAAHARRKNTGVELKPQTDNTADRGAPDFQRQQGLPIITTDDMQNSIIIYDYADKYNYYQQLIASLDNESEQIEIQVTILDLQVSKYQELGANFLASGNSAQLAVTGSEIARQSITRSGLSVHIAKAVSSSSPLNGVINNVDAVINALAGNREGQIISQPKIVTMNNTPALIDNSESFYVRLQSEYYSNLQEVNYGTVLKVTPTLLNNPDGRKILLDVNISDGNIDDRRMVDNIPYVKKTSIITESMVHENASLVLGGYYYDSTQTEQSGVPILKDIPIIKHLFSTQTSQRRKYVRLFFITPKVVDSELQNVVLKETSDEVSKFKQLNHLPKSVNSGIFERFNIMD